MASIELKSISKYFAQLQVIKAVDLYLDEGEFVVFVGPSGCGKSTLLRIIAGLEEADRGQILLDGQDVSQKLPSERGLSMVFQSYALYPHMSVRENIGFGLKTAGVAKAAIETKVSEVAAILKLDVLLDRQPKQLSGGQRQRVAIGRAIAREPVGFLFDEPLSNLDAALRVNMRIELSKLHQELGITSIYVTHDQVEAMTLADRIVVLNAGKVMQVGTPKELYNRPVNRFVAEFIGSPKMNVLPGEMHAHGLYLAGQSALQPVLEAADSNCAHLGIRPEHIRFCDESEAFCSGRVDVVEYLGADLYIYVQTEQTGMITLRASADIQIQPNETVYLGFEHRHLHLFDGSGRAVETQRPD